MTGERITKTEVRSLEALRNNDVVAQNIETMTKYLDDNDPVKFYLLDRSRTAVTDLNFYKNNLDKALSTGIAAINEGRKPGLKKLTSDDDCIREIQAAHAAIFQELVKLEQKKEEDRIAERTIRANDPGYQTLAATMDSTELTTRYGDGRIYKTPKIDIPFVSSIENSYSWKTEDKRSTLTYENGKGIWSGTKFSDIPSAARPAVIDDFVDQLKANGKEGAVVSLDILTKEKYTQRSAHTRGHGWMSGFSEFKQYKTDVNNFAKSIASKGLNLEPVQLSWLDEKTQEQYHKIKAEKAAQKVPLTPKSTFSELGRTPEVSAPRIGGRVR